MQNHYKKDKLVEFCVKATGQEIREWVRYTQMLFLHNWSTWACHMLSETDVEKYTNLKNQIEEKALNR